MYKFFQVLVYPILCCWYGYRWFFKTVRYATIPEMNTEGICGYTDKPFYFIGEEVSFYLHLPEGATLTILKLIGDYKEKVIFSQKIERKNQLIPQDASLNGCNWDSTYKLLLDEQFTQGYYKAMIDDDQNNFPITFLIGKKNLNASTIVLAPVSTWAAYNAWGGKSLYKNGVDHKSVYEVSTLRPNSCIQYNAIKNINDIHIESHIFNWLNEEVEVMLLPDYYLESNAALFQQAKLMVLSYHCEYISGKMYSSLRKLISKGGSLLSLGGNQVFWKVKWKENFTKMECRKNLTFFKGTLLFGGGWRHSFYPEDEWLGVRYTNKGDGTYAPYEVKNANHFLFEETNVKNGQLFGEKGFNGFGISGDETDERFAISSSTVEILARGLNPKRTGDYKNYDGSKEWDGQGGGEITFKRLHKKNAVLATGSINSGAGLGVDKVFTSIVRNFIKKYSH